MAKRVTLREILDVLLDLQIQKMLNIKRVMIQDNPDDTITPHIDIEVIYDFPVNHINVDVSVVN